MICIPCIWSNYIRLQPAPNQLFQSREAITCPTSSGTLARLCLKLTCLLLCLGAHAPKAYGRFVCQSFCMSITPFSQRSLTPESTEWAQRDNISNLIVLYFWIKALFSRYGMICSLEHYCGTFQTQSGSPCILTLGSIQQLQLLTAKLRSKHAILANWI